MGSSKIETTIAYKLDARGLREAKRELDKSFKPETVKALNAALKDARSRVKDLSLEYSRAAKAQGAMANAPKALRANLKAARDEVSKLTSDLGKQLAAEKKLLEVSKAQAQLARENRGTAFRQGAYQGFGGAIAGYMQRREQATTQEQRAELRAQFMGQMVGGMGRRALGGARAALGMASGMVGGQGPMGALLGGIPFLGGTAQLAESAVGSFVQRQQAQLGAMPYAGMPRQLTAGRAGRAAVPGRWELPPKGPTDLPGGSMEDRVQEAKHEARVAQHRRQWIIAREKEGEEGPQAIIKGADASAESLRAALKRKRDKAKPGAKYVPGTPGEAAQAATFSDPTAGMKAAVHGLLTGTEAIQAGTAFTKQVGGRYNDAQFKQGFAAETIHGVDQSASAGLFRAQRAGRGGTSRDPTNMLAKAIGAATAQGLEGSEIGEYLDTIASAQADAASRGLSLETETLTELGTALSRGLGLAGPQAGRVAGNITAAAQGVVTQGARGPIDIQMLRAAGFDPAKGNFLETRRKLAGGMDASSTFDLLESLVGGEGDALKRGYTLERSGLGLGTEQALALQEKLKLGKEAFMGSMAGAGTGSAADLLAGMAMTDPKTGKATTLGQITGAVRGQVGVQNQLAAAGGAAAANVQQLQQQAAAMATTMATSLKPFMDPLTKNIVQVSKGIESLMKMIGEWGSSGDGIPVKIIGG